MFIGDWRWIDLAGSPNGLDWFAFVLGVIGFIIAMRQLTKTSGSLKAAKESLDHTRKSLIRNQILTTVSSFEGILGRVDSAVAANDRDSLGDELTTFSFRAHEVSALLKDVDEETDEIGKALYDLADNVSRARSSLYDSPNVEVHNLVRASLGHVRVLVPQVHALGVTLKYTPMTPPATMKGK